MYAQSRVAMATPPPLQDLAPQYREQNNCGSSTYKAEFDGSKVSSMLIVGRV